MNVWFLKDVASEDCFAKDLHDQFSQVWFDMENRGQMMLELERLGGREVAVDFLDRLRLMQKSDAEKHVSLRRMLLEAFRALVLVLDFSGFALEVLFGSYKKQG
ncbi:hypothetical protein Tco_1576002 [Tanacetum coccineum]